MYSARIRQKHVHACDYFDNVLAIVLLILLLLFNDFLMIFDFTPRYIYDLENEK